MYTSESLLERNDAGLTVVDRPSDRPVLRRLLVIAVVLLVIGLIVFAGLSGFAADPMAGT